MLYESKFIVGQLNEPIESLRLLLHVAPSGLYTCLENGTRGLEYISRTFVLA
jgi:hypothetical protein